MFEDKQLLLLMMVTMLPCTQYAEQEYTSLTPNQANESLIETEHTADSSLKEKEETEAINKAIDNYIAKQRLTLDPKNTHGLEFKTDAKDSPINNLQAACANIQTKAQEQFETIFSSRSTKSQKAFKEKMERMQTYSLRVANDVKTALEAHQKSLVEISKKHGSLETTDAQKDAKIASALLTNTIKNICDNSAQDIANVLAHIPEKAINKYLKAAIPATITLILQSE